MDELLELLEARREAGKSVSERQRSVSINGTVYDEILKRCRVERLLMDIVGESRPSQRRRDPRGVFRSGDGK